MYRVFVFLFSLAFLLVDSGCVMAMSSSNYNINWDTVGVGGDDTADSANYSLRDTIGGFAVGTSTGSSYQLSGGYRALESLNSITFVTKTQDASVQGAYTALNISGKTVTLSAATSSFSAGDYVAVAENKGFSQLVVVGKVSSVLGAVITVDRFDGATGTIGATPSGDDDYVYRLGSASVAFGKVSTSGQNTAISMVSVLSSVPTGYTVYVQGNQTLKNESATVISSPATTIALGTEAYGASVTGTRAYLPDTDIGVTTTARAIARSTTISSSGPERVAMTYKLSITASTSAGNYSQNVYYTVTANY